MKRQKEKPITRSLFLLKQRHNKALTMPGCIGIHMKNIMWTQDVQEYLRNNTDTLRVEFNRKGEVIRKESYKLQSWKWG